MGERVWTKEQLSAIETRDKTLLVSAAAGSGKTATLTERIIRSLTDPVNPESIDSLLVVTFTVAAAAELRSKISAALAEAIAKSPENKHLERQIHMLPSATIRTIDSFCNDLLRQNTDRVGIPPNYRIADSAECELLATAILDGLIEGVYNGELSDIASPEEFEELADCLTDSKRTEELANVFRLIYAYCESAEEGVDSLLPLINNYADSTLPPEKTVFGEYLMNHCNSLFMHYSSVIRECICELSSGGPAESACLVTAEKDKEILERLICQKTYEGLRLEILNFQLPTKATVKASEKTAATESYAQKREIMKSDVKSLAVYFNYTAEEWKPLFETLYRLLGIVYRFEKRFEELFLDEKRRRGAFSYSDIERYTYKCLIKDGEPTDIAKNLSKKYSAIYIDEYQDVNSLQNRIFEVISRSDNRFMVGDIKQSIYCFRHARPEIFASMKSSFPPIEKASGDVATVFMSSNFRCDKGIVDFVNGVFDKAFSLMRDSIGYTEGDRLEYAKKQDLGEPVYHFPEVCMLDWQSEDSQDMEAEVVAEKIKVLLSEGRLDSGEAVRPSDIAIILRNTKGKASKYVEALMRRGIPSSLASTEPFFTTPEVLLAMCLLNSIDNPRRDIYLAGLMCSPLFSFTSDEMLAIRTVKCETLYESLREYTEANPEFVKGISFLNTLSYYRTISEGIGVDKLIYKLFRETGLLALASKNGGRDNLTLLYDYARQFESGGFKGLYNFIGFINNINGIKNSFDDKRSGAEQNAVTIITGHGSKGLEYPIVFLASAGTRISNKDAQNKLAFSAGFGMAFRLRTPSGLALVNNPIRSIIDHRVLYKLYEEELRILYVVLTRARERLYIVGTTPPRTSNRDKYLDKIRILRETLSGYSVRTLNSFLEIVLVAGERCAPMTVNEFLGGKEIDVSQSLENEEEQAEAELTHEVNSQLCKELVSRFTYEYPNQYLTELPEKMSVSNTSPTVLDGTDGESDTPKKESISSRGRLPAFALGTSADESAKRGIATHLFLQFCDLENLVENGASGELSRLLERGFISTADAERVRLGEIEMFIKSELFSEMRNAEKIYREFRFNVRLPAAEFTGDEERKAAYLDREILVQGVIDCIVVRRDGSLGLYDYKTDRLTREELSDRSLAEATLREKHRTQLTLYSLVAERIFGIPVERLEVYSLALGDTVSMK